MKRSATVYWVRWKKARVYGPYEEDGQMKVVKLLNRVVMSDQRENPSHPHQRL